MVTFDVTAPQLLLVWNFAIAAYVLRGYIVAWVSGCVCVDAGCLYRMLGVYAHICRDDIEFSVHVSNKKSGLPHDVRGPSVG